MNIKSMYSFAVVSSLVIWNINSAVAAPTDGQVAAGAATISQSGLQTTINQTSNSAVINWKGFDTAANESVNFTQPNANAVALNRITSGLPTNFAGNLNANGKVFVVNPSGVVFVAGSHVTTSGFLATTMDVKDDDFMSGSYKFFSQPGSETSSIINNGTIVAKNAGFVALIAPNAANAKTGIIQADYGKVALASGSTFVLDFNQDSLINFDASSLVKTGHVENAGTISASSGKVFLTANDIAKVLDDTVSNSGVSEANTVTVSSSNSSPSSDSGDDNNVVILGSPDDGMIKVSGKIDAGKVKLCAANGINIDAPITADLRESLNDSAVIAHTQNGNIVINDKITVAHCGRTAGSISLTASNGSITETGLGAVITNNLTTASSTGTSLNSDANLFNNLTGLNTTSGNLYFRNLGYITVNGITQNGGDLTLSAGGALNQDDLPSHAIKVSGATNLISGSDINLQSDNNFIGALNVSTTGSFTQQHSSHTIVLGNVSVDNLDIENRAGAISQTSDGAVIVTGKTMLKTQDAPIALNNPGNQFSSWITLENSIYADQNVSLNNSVDTEIDHVNAGGILTITTTGGLYVYDSLNSYASFAPKGHAIILSTSNLTAKPYQLHAWGNNNSYLIYLPNIQAVNGYFGNIDKVYNTPYSAYSSFKIEAGNHVVIADGQPA